MKLMSNQNVERLDKIRLCLVLALTAAWVVVVAFLPPDPWETPISTAGKCAVVVVLVLVGEFAHRLSEIVRDYCIYAAFLATAIVRTGAADETTWKYVLCTVLGVCIVLGYVVDWHRAKHAAMSVTSG